ncbi:MAG: hypothetical protein A2W61_08315 [Deltaproteobacteria bacterium RIFCSPLOWO2_01_44_7]|nr:MAG: hypothetical protein A2712_02275 [Deltaproteobacteria bacterium RIFCSPHIGHO2_01_FULL_43_49]OGQ15049.1 MAG: hypothetical protein A3D22_03205 [Deltaproteobacteria bacterium RIFCSPHIGHO2_02_FULL_44_53]OGQ27332.1 MAG: hypothetical protein A3D98_02870 [Deltaproteobacteria bacterium RIFCSPHIGHO2_12_FULL_44_21]OGQ31566.1 MAG: hypothetical protein A2979_04365 [Deltaproteobacteria bacterium RIFCSPLOWO2_01_FULL_45_74]OGQ42623.1 MAG: hypothetical protein A2W61_08315 [Deltaproteobacteria bacterium 
MTRIALLSRFHFDQVKRGLEAYALHLQKAFPQIEIIRLDGFSPIPKMLDLNLSRFCLEEVKQSWWLSRNFLQRHKKNPFDLVITSGEGGWHLALKKLNIPRVHIYALCGAAYADSALKKGQGPFSTKYLYGSFERLSGYGASCVSISEKVCQEVEERYHWNSKMIPVGIDLNQFAFTNPEEARKRIAPTIPTGKPIGLFVGQAEYAKGWDIVEQLASQFPQIQFVCILTNKITPLYPNIVIKNNLTNEEMTLWYNAADFFVFPSRYESAALVVLEAMACNLPVVVSKPVADVCLDPDANLDSSKGVYVTLENHVEKYVEAIENLLSKNKRATTRPYVEQRRSFKKFRDDYQKLITTLLNGKLLP